MTKREITREFKLAIARLDLNRSNYNLLEFEKWYDLYRYNVLNKKAGVKL
jgi:hypothetical protein